MWSNCKYLPKLHSKYKPTDVRCFLSPKEEKYENMRLRYQTTHETPQTINEILYKYWSNNRQFTCKVIKIKHKYIKFRYILYKARKIYAGNYLDRIGRGYSGVCRVFSSVILASLNSQTKINPLFIIWGNNGRLQFFLPKIVSILKKWFTAPKFSPLWEISANLHLRLKLKAHAGGSLYNSTNCPCST